MGNAWACTILLARTTRNPLEMVQELLGHASIVATRTVYAHYLSSAVRDAYFASALREAQDGAAAP
jgi:integrase